MVDFPEAGRQRVAGAPWRLSRTQPEVSRHAPMLGEHSFEVFHEHLGLTEPEYEALVAANLTGDGPPE